jgi:hypothetical protein
VGGEKGIHGHQRTISVRATSYRPGGCVCIGAGLSGAPAIAIFLRCQMQCEPVILLIGFFVKRCQANGCWNLGVEPAGVASRVAQFGAAYVRGLDISHTRIAQAGQHEIQGLQEFQVADLAQPVVRCCLSMMSRCLPGRSHLCS